ncbi:glycosyltransferase family 2 protein [Aquabacter sp. CN5-332]|uniref:glycosyltransferase family 2 protein n=1 Tax=Aquabacter sp. CN5-332 TaxID=3156608 RepID=UPI0032B4EDDA
MRRFTLPLPLKLRLLSGGYVFALELAKEDASGDISEAWGPGDAVSLQFMESCGKVIGRTEIIGPLTAVFIPRGTAVIAARAAPGLRIGVFPRSKVGLKLHAFLRGSFPRQPVHKRWSTAAAGARNLRGIHATLLEGSSARKQEQAVRYRRYRASYVEDFATVVPPRPDLRLTFLSVLDGEVEDAAARLAALNAQTDPDWTWIAALPPEAPAALAAWARANLAGGARTYLIEPGTSGAEALNAALAMVDDGLVAYLPRAGRPMRDAVAMIRAAFNAHPDCRVTYTDEERLDGEGTPVSGLFKPAFNRHLLRAGDYLGNIVTLRADFLKDLGGLRPSFAAAARYDLLLRALETLPSTAVRHIPRIAFSARETGREPGTAPAPEQAARALQEALGTPVEVLVDGRLLPRVSVPEPAPLVSIVIPTRDRADLMGMALRSLIAHTRYRNFEIVIVDNGSVEPATFALFEETKAAWPETVVVRDDGSFNYPRICNGGVAASKGSIICLLNNDIEVVDGDWLEEMVALVMQPRTGIVGAKLLFPDRTAQHVGVIVGLFRYAAHWFSHAAADAPGPFGRLICRTNVSAVTGACLMIRRNCWDTIGPLDAERFAEDCNDIDLCLRARRAGFEVVWTPFACLLHHESASRGRRRTKAHRNRLKEQRKRMEDLWGTRDMVDPHYNPNLSRTSLHAALATAPEGPRDSRTDEV